MANLAFDEIVAAVKSPGRSRTRYFLYLSGGVFLIAYTVAGLRDLHP